MSHHTKLDLKAFEDAGIDPKKRGFREIPKRCPFHDARHPVTTFNLQGFCDDPDHYKPPPMFEGDPNGAGVITIGVPA